MCNAVDAILKPVERLRVPRTTFDPALAPSAVVEAAVVEGVTATWLAPLRPAYVTPVSTRRNNQSDGVRH